MSRLRLALATIVPSMLAGGLLFSSAFGHAEGGRDDAYGFWPATNDVAAPRPPLPPLPPAMPSGRTPPMPPMPPMPGTHRHSHRSHGSGGSGGSGGWGGNGGSGSNGGISISIHDGELHLDGIRMLVTQQLDTVRENLMNNPSIPADVRDKVLGRLDRVRRIVDKRLSGFKVDDLDHVGEALDQMGEEIDHAMDGLDRDVSKLGDRMGRDIARQVTDRLGKSWSSQLAKSWGNFNVHVGHDDSDDKDSADDADDNDSDDDDGASANPGTPDVDVDTDDSDLKEALSDLKGFALKPMQRDLINKLRTESDRTVDAAKQQIETLSNQLHDALGNTATTDTEVSRYVDQISAQEAVIRKARILAWVNARRLLDDGQRKKVEDAVKKPGK